MSSLAKSVLNVGSFTLLSRILGFARDLVFAQVFGANANTDAFFVAFKIPNFLRRLFGEGAFATAFVPVLSEYRATREFSDLKTFVDHVAGTLGMVLLGVTALGVFGAPLLVLLFAPGFAGDPVKQQLAADMLQLTFPYLLFISLTAFAGGILNTFGRFAVPAFTPVLLNLVLIACALWLAPLMDQPIVALAWGVLIAGITQFVFQLPFLKRIDLLPGFRVAPKDPGVRKILRLMGPAIFGVSVTQLNLLLDTLIASFLVSGSISWLYYSDRLVEFPVGILGVALGTVVLPGLSSRHAEKSAEAFSQMMDWGLRLIFLLGIPSMIGLALLAKPMIATLFLSDVFDAHDVEMATRSLWAYSAGLMPFMLIKVLAPGYYARQDTRTPVRIAVIAMVSNMVMNIILVFPLQHAGLALATSLSACLNALLLYRGLKKEGVYQPQRGWLWLLPRIFLASLLMALAIEWLGPSADFWLQAERMEKILWLPGLIIVGGAVFFAVLGLSGVRLRHFRNRPL